MAVISCVESSQGASGSASGEGPLSVQVKYKASYRVQVDSQTDSPTTVLEYFRQTPGVPWIGKYFRFGNGFDAGAICKSIDPVQDPNAGDWYEVDVAFEPIQNSENESGQDEEGKAQEDPFLWHDDIDISFTQTTVPVYKAIYHEGMKGRAHGLRKPGTAGAVVNSAQVPFDPPLEKEIDIKIIRFTRNVPDWDEFLYRFLRQKVNNAVVKIRKQAYKFSDQWEPYQARIKNVSGAFQIVNNIPCWKRQIEVWINPLGWREVILDQGVERRAMDGDPDGAGGTISASDIEPGMPFQKRIVDSDGYPITSPVNLDGDGQPLIPGKDAVYLTYAIHDEINFPNLW